MWQFCHRGGKGWRRACWRRRPAARALIATDVPGCREIARRGINALLVPPDDAKALAEAIETMLKDRDLDVRFSQASRQIVIAEYSSAQIGGEIVALYACMLAGPSPSPLWLRSA